MRRERGQVRVRVAPSPTGPLHIGTARTALFNFLFARKHKGAFVLRVEDTDLLRNEKKFEEDILENLRWLGLSWDEGPDLGGPFSPYRQSERANSYAKRIRQLLENDRAYYCFCSEQELEHERDEQRKKGEVLRYSGVCGKLSKKEAEERAKKGMPSVIRFRMPEEIISYVDLIRGKLKFDMRLVGDIVIAKDEKTPLYNFAAVVDDYEMKINYVLRGEDHIANTPKQLAIAKALGLTAPEFGHFPLVLGSDRSKLSKRHGATTVKELREAGYYPEALINFLVLLGWNPGTKKEIFSLEELTGIFDLSRVQEGGAIWNQEKLNWFNRFYAARVKPPENAKDRVVEGFKANNLPVNFSIAAATASIFSHISPQELGDKIGDFSYLSRAPRDISFELLRWKDMTIDDVKNALDNSLNILKKINIKKDWNREVIEKIMVLEAEKWGSGDKGRLLWPLRAALSGKKQSISPFEIAEAIGQEEALKRIKNGINSL